METAVYIKATNYADEIGSIKFIDSIFSTMNIPTSMKIQSEHPLTIALDFIHNIIQYETIEIKNIANFTLNQNEFESKNVTFNSGLVLLDQNTFQRSLIYMDKYTFSNWTENNITDSKFVIDSDCYTGFGLCMNHFEMWNNEFFDTDIEFKRENREDQSYRNITMRNNVFLLGSLKDKYSIQNNMDDVIIDGRENYFSYRTGPSICSNPNGRGYRVSLMFDYSFWCLSPNCNEFNTDPQLLNDTLRYPCDTYKKGTVASIVIFSLMFTLIAIAGLYLFLYKFIPTSTDKIEATHYRLHILSLGVAIHSFYSLGLPIASKIVNSQCQTRVPAPSCVFTLFDSQISSILIMLWFFIMFSNIAITVLISTRHFRLYGIYYMFLIINIACICFPGVLAFEIFILILDYMSSKVMVVALINLLIVIVFEGISLSFLLKLKKNLKEVSIIFDEPNEYTQRRLLSESIDNEGNNDGPQPVSDGSFNFYYSDYKKRTLRNLLYEIISLGILFPFVIWFTVKYVAPGVYCTIVVLFNIGRVVYGFSLLKGTHSKIHNLYMIIASFSGIAAGVIFIICGAIIFVNISVNPSAYFVLILTLVWGITYVLSFEKTRTIRNNLDKIENGNTQRNRYMDQQTDENQYVDRLYEQEEVATPPTYETNRYEEI